MKRVLIFVVATALFLSLWGCKGVENSDNATTTVTATTINVEENNKKVYARLGMEDLVSLLNMFAAYDEPLSVGANDTVNDILEKMRQTGSVVDTSNINKNARFFDYAMENPDNKDGKEPYIIREDVDWLPLYVD